MGSWASKYGAGRWLSGGPATPAGAFTMAGHHLTRGTAESDGSSQLFTEAATRFTRLTSAQATTASRDGLRAAPSLSLLSQLL